jgi:hypothetical protein
MTRAISSETTDSAAWKAGSFHSASAYSIELTAEEQDAIRAAIASIEVGKQMRPVHRLKAEGFYFGRLEPKLQCAYEEVRSGRGFVLIRNIPHEGWSLVQYRAAVWGIGTRFGYALSQNAQGELISDVVDATNEDATPRMYRSNLELGLHNDPTAMLALACWNPAQRGGVSVFASALTIYGEIRKCAPHLLPHLHRGFHYHRLGEEGPDEEPVTPYRVPVFAVCRGQVSCRNTRAGYIAGHHELSIPINDDELEAIDLFDKIARRPENQLPINLERGDMVVINNYTVLHARTAFEDYADPERKRLLLRLWLDAEGFRDVPKEFNLFKTNGVPYQPGRKCTYDFKKLFEEVRPELLGRGPDKDIQNDIESLDPRS